MIKHRLTKFCGKSCTCFCCKKLGGDADSQTCACHKDQNQKAPDNDTAVIFCNSHINHVSDHNRNHQVKYNFQKLEKGSKYGLFFVVF